MKLDKLHDTKNTLCNIRRPLPELERARLQLQSPMPSNPGSPKPRNPDTPPGIQASKHPGIPDCRNPSFDHLKGEALGPSRGPQGISGRQTLSPPMLHFGPKTLKKTMRKLRAWKADPKVENEWPETQSAHACAVQTHLVTFPKNSKSR